MSEITFYQFLESPYTIQKLEYNKIRKSNDKGAEWKLQLILVCNSRDISKLKLLALTSFCKRYISELKDGYIPKPIKVGTLSSILDADNFLIKNNIPERYAKLFSEISIAKLKKMNLKQLIEINGIGKSTAKKIHELIS